MPNRGFDLWAGTLGLLLAVGLSAGCADLSYDRIELNAGPQNWDRALPDLNKRQSDEGIAWGQDRGPRMDAILVQYGPDRRVYGKWQASFVNRRTWLSHEQGYRLRGEFDPAIAEVDQAGPFDVLRLLFSELVVETEDPVVRGAHSLIGIGVRRIFEQFPSEANPPELPAAWERDWSERIGATGLVTITRRPTGRYHISYVTGDVAEFER